MNSTSVNYSKNHIFTNSSNGEIVLRAGPGETLRIEGITNSIENLNISNGTISNLTTTNTVSANITNTNLITTNIVATNTSFANLNINGLTLTNLVVTSSTQLRSITSETVNFSTGFSIVRNQSMSGSNAGLHVGIDLDGTTVCTYMGNIDNISGSDADGRIFGHTGDSMTFFDEEFALTATNPPGLASCGTSSYSKITASYGYIWIFNHQTGVTGDFQPWVLRKNGSNLESPTVLAISGTGSPRVDVADYKNYKSGNLCASCSNGSTVWFFNVNGSSQIEQTSTSITSTSVCCTRISGTSYYFTSNTTTNGTIRCYNFARTNLFTYTGTASAPVGSDICISQEADANGLFTLFSLSSSGNTLVILKFSTSSGFSLFQTISLSNTYNLVKCVRSGLDCYLLRNTKNNVLNVRFGNDFYRASSTELTLSASTETFEVINNGTNEYLLSGNNSAANIMYLGVISKSATVSTDTNTFLLNNTSCSLSTVLPININTNSRPINISCSLLSVGNFTTTNLSALGINTSSLTTTNLVNTNLTNTNSTITTLTAPTINGTNINTTSITATNLVSPNMPMITNIRSITYTSNSNISLVNGTTVGFYASWDTPTFTTTGSLSSITFARNNTGGDTWTFNESGMYYFMWDNRTSTGTYRNCFVFTRNLNTAGLNPQPPNTSILYTHNSALPNTAFQYSCGFIFTMTAGDVFRIGVYSNSAPAAGSIIRIFQLFR